MAYKPPKYPIVIFFLYAGALFVFLFSIARPYFKQFAEVGTTLGIFTSFFGIIIGAILGGVIGVIVTVIIWAVRTIKAK